MCDHDQPDRLGFRGMYGQERGSDVEFEVGPEGGQTWRLTAHRRVLAASSPVMRALLFGPLAPLPLRRSPAPPIRVSDVDPRAFQCLLRYLYGLVPQLQTVPTALATLYAAHKYLCVGLEWECVSFLNEQVLLRPDYVLDILQAVSFFCQRKEQWEPTAPPAEDLESDSEGSRLVCTSPQHESTCSGPEGARRGSSELGALGEACLRLRHNCLQVVDQNADLVLALEQVEDLDQETLLSMTSRDTLAASNELLVFRAAERWAECECKRRKLPLASHHMRQALGGPHVVCSGRLARLLLLSPQLFAEGPARSLLLSGEEQRSLLVHLVGSSAVDGPTSPPSSPEHVAWGLLATPRIPSTPQYLYIPPSQNPTRCDERPQKCTKSRHWGLRWPRSKRKSKPSREKSITEKQESVPERPGCCSRTCELFITALACLFD